MTALKQALFYVKLQKASGGNDERSKFEKDRIEHAKRIMKPFFLRRLKSEVLTALPAKNEEVLKVPMTQEQHETYFRLVQTYKQRAKDVSSFDEKKFKKCGTFFFLISDCFRKNPEYRQRIWCRHVNEFAKNRQSPVTHSAPF